VLRRGDGSVFLSSSPEIAEELGDVPRDVSNAVR
jgi:hypothetical protein